MPRGVVPFQHAVLAHPVFPGPYVIDEIVRSVHGVGVRRLRQRRRVRVLRLVVRVGVADEVVEGFRRAPWRGLRGRAVSAETVLVGARRSGAVHGYALRLRHSTVSARRRGNESGNRPTTRYYCAVPLSVRYASNTDVTNAKHRDARKNGRRRSSTVPRPAATTGVMDARRRDEDDGPNAVRRTTDRWPRIAACRWRRGRAKNGRAASSLSAVSSRYRAKRPVHGRGVNRPRRRSARRAGSSRGVRGRGDGAAERRGCSPPERAARVRRVHAGRVSRVRSAACRVVRSTRPSATFSKSTAGPAVRWDVENVRAVHPNGKY